MKVWRDGLKVGDVVWYWHRINSHPRRRMEVTDIRPGRRDPRRVRVFLTWLDGIGGAVTDLWNVYPTRESVRPVRIVPPHRSGATDAQL